jgi:hypothetical protein
MPGAGTADVTAACSTQFDALAARFKKCGREAVMGMLPLESSRAGFVKSCIVQSSRPGTGYSVAQRKGCTEALSSTTCTADAAIIKACAVNRGEFNKGLACNTDDQCKDGYCALPSGAKPGSSCGVCGTPVWKSLSEQCYDESHDKESFTQTRCEFGLICRSNSIQANYGRRFCEPLIDCADGKCSSVPRVGLSCATDWCGIGLECDSKTKLCVGRPTEGQPGIVGGGAYGACDEWTSPNAVKQCEVKAALTCN